MPLLWDLICCTSQMLLAIILIVCVFRANLDNKCVLENKHPFDFQNVELSFIEKQSFFCNRLVDKT